MHGFLRQLSRTPKGNELEADSGRIGWGQLRESRPHLADLALFYAAYILAAGLGQGLTLVPGVAVTFWPPAGIFTAVLVLTRKVSWPWWIAVGCLAELTCNAMWFHSAIHFALIYFAANALVATTAATLITRAVGQPFQFEEFKSMAAVVILGAGVAPMISATVIATTDFLIGKHAFWTAWPLVWLGDSTGLLVSAPLTLIAVEAWRVRFTISPARLLELVAVFAALAALGLLSLRGYLTTPYEMLPPLLWAAARFQLRGAAASLALTAIMLALFAAPSVDGVTGEGGEIAEKVVGLQIFLGIAAVSSLFIAVISQRHKEAVQSLKDVNDDLETRVVERTAALRESEELNRSTLHALPAHIAVIDGIGRIIAVNQAWNEFAANDAAEAGSNLGVGARYLDVCRQAAAEDANAAKALAGIDAVLAGRAKQFVMEYSCHSTLQQSWFLMSVAPFHSGSQRGAVISHLDITGRKEAEQRLADNELRYRTLVSATSAVTWHCPPSGLHIEPQAEWMAFTGQSAQEMLGAGWTKALHPEDLAAAVSRWQEAVDRGAPLSSEHRIRRHDGEWRWMNVQAVPVRDGGGQVVEWFGMNIDINDRKQIEESLRQSEAQLRLALNAGEAGTWSWDAVTNISKWDQRYHEQYGFSTSAPVAIETWLAHVHPDDRAMLQSRLQTIMQTPGDAHWRMEFRAVHPKFGVRWMLGLGQVERDNEGQVTGMSGLNLDVTERVNTQESLRESDAKFQQAGELARFGAYSFDVLGRGATWSSGFWRMLGRGEITQMSLETFVGFIHPDDQTRVAETVQKVIRQIGPYEFEYRITKADGSHIWVMDRGETSGAVDPETGMVSHAAGMILDITDRKHHEEHQTLLMNELNHRVKNTLATIQSIASQTLRSSPSLAEAKTRFEARLISLSKAHDVLTREKWDSAPLTDIVDRALLPYRASGKDRFTVGGPGIRISAQMALALAMALHELCTNAVKYGALSNSKGQVTIAWSVSGRKQSRSILKLRWSEKGGPPVTQPTARGFGTKLIERSLASDLDGDAKVTFAKTGVVCTITASLHEVNKSRSENSASPQNGATGA